MSLHTPRDPFLVDALGAAKFARETLKLSLKRRENFDAAIYWAARCAAHWALRSEAWKVSGSFVCYLVLNLVAMKLFP